jgi:hypothetical protein
MFYDVAAHGSAALSDDYCRDGIPDGYFKSEWVGEGPELWITRVQSTRLSGERVVHAILADIETEVGNRDWLRQLAREGTPSPSEWLRTEAAPEALRHKLTTIGELCFLLDSYNGAFPHANFENRCSMSGDLLNHTSTFPRVMLITKDLAEGRMPWDKKYYFASMSAYFTALAISKRFQIDHSTVVYASARAGRAPIGMRL